MRPLNLASFLLLLSIATLLGCSTLLPASVTERAAESLGNLCERSTWPERQVVLNRINQDAAAKGAHVTLTCPNDPPPDAVEGADAS